MGTDCSRIEQSTEVLNARNHYEDDWWHDRDKAPRETAIRLGFQRSIRLGVGYVQGDLIRID
jgi:hypothetical protein